MRALPRTMASIALLLTMLYGAAAHAEVFVTMVGSRQGPLRGDSTTPGRTNQTVVSAFQYEVRVATDPATGQPLGKRQHSPVTFTKAVGPSSPQLFEAMFQNENLSTVTFEFVALTGEGSTQVVQRVRLTNAVVSDVRQHAGPLRGTWLEDVSLTFQSITITHVPTGIAATDSPAAP